MYILVTHVHAGAGGAIEEHGAGALAGLARDAAVAADEGHEVGGARRVGILRKDGVME